MADEVNEHQYAVRMCKMNSGSLSHAWQSEHTVHWSSAKAKTYEVNIWKRKVLEAIEIQKTGTHLYPGLCTATQPRVAESYPFRLKFCPTLAFLSFPFSVTMHLFLFPPIVHMLVSVFKTTPLIYFSECASCNICSVVSSPADEGLSCTCMLFLKPYL